jgi:hypothetical protein
LRIRVLVTLVAMAAAGSSVFYATHVASPLTRHVVQSPYTTTEVLEFLVFSTGRVAAEHPALDKQRTVTMLSDTQARAAADSITECIRSIDAAAPTALTKAFNAADPQRLDSALRRFDAAASRWLAAPYKQDDPCPPPPPPPSAPPDNGSAPGWWYVNGYGAWDFVLAGWDFYGGALTLGVVGAIAAALLTMVVLVVFVTAVLVPAFIFYEFEAPPSDLDRQTAIAKIVRALRA